MSNKKLAGIIAGCIIVVTSVVAPATLGSNPPKQVTDYTTLLLHLRNSGASIVEEGEIPRQVFFGIEGKRLKVNGSIIQVYEYESAEAMEAEASCVSSDGFGITKERGDMGMHKEMHWIDLPHFHKAGRIIALYVGDSDSIISLLENALGKQFAGM
jgi:hypothetical protein